MIGQHALVSPPITTHPPQIAHPGSIGTVARLPIGVEPLTPPPHPNPVTLVKPVPTQASPVRV